MTNWYLTSVLRRFNESRIVFQQMMLGQPNIHMQKNEVGTDLIPHTKTNSKWVKRLTVWAESTKLLENIGADLCDFKLGNFFSYYIKNISIGLKR